LEPLLAPQTMENTTEEQKKEWIEPELKEVELETGSSQKNTTEEFSYQFTT
jgi:hypothetical protein